MNALILLTLLLMSDPALIDESLNEGLSSNDAELFQKAAENSQFLPFPENLPDDQPLSLPLEKLSSSFFPYWADFEAGLKSSSPSFARQQQFKQKLAQTFANQSLKALKIYFKVVARSRFKNSPRGAMNPNQLKNMLEPYFKKSFHSPDLVKNIEQVCASIWEQLHDDPSQASLPIQLKNDWRLLDYMFLDPEDHALFRRSLIPERKNASSVQLSIRLCLQRWQGQKRLVPQSVLGRFFELFARDHDQTDHDFMTDLENLIAQMNRLGHKLNVQMLMRDFFAIRRNVIAE